jgi:hypothetical protein
VRDAGCAFKMAGLHLRCQFSHPGGAARALQAVGNHRHTAGIVATVFQPCQSLYQNRNNVAGRDSANNATHDELQKDEWRDRMLIDKKYGIN